jgi:hypothetical protein
MLNPTLRDYLCKIEEINFSRKKHDLPNGFNRDKKIAEKVQII